MNSTRAKTEFFSRVLALAPAALTKAATKQQSAHTAARTYSTALPYLRSARLRPRLGHTLGVRQRAGADRTRNREFLMRIPITILFAGLVTLPLRPDDSPKRAATLIADTLDWYSTWF